MQPNMVCASTYGVAHPAYRRARLLALRIFCSSLRTWAVTAHLAHLEECLGTPRNDCATLIFNFCLLPILGCRWVEQSIENVPCNSITVRMIQDWLNCYSLCSPGSLLRMALSAIRDSRDGRDAWGPNSNINLVIYVLNRYALLLGACLQFLGYVSILHRSSP